MSYIHRQGSGGSCGNARTTGRKRKRKLEQTKPSGLTAAVNAKHGQLPPEPNPHTEGVTHQLPPDPNTHTEGVTHQLPPDPDPHTEGLIASVPGTHMSCPALHSRLQSLKEQPEEKQPASALGPNMMRILE